MRQFSDDDLVEEIRAGSHVAFGLLMKRYERLVYRIGFYYSRQPESAMDITQNVFLKTYQKLDLFKGTGAFKSWLLRIARNESTDWLRKNRRHMDDVELTPINTPDLQPVQESEVRTCSSGPPMLSSPQMSDTSRVPSNTIVLSMMILNLAVWAVSVDWVHELRSSLHRSPAEATIHSDIPAEWRRYAADKASQD